MFKWQADDYYGSCQRSAPVAACIAMLAGLVSSETEKENSNIRILTVYKTVRTVIVKAVLTAVIVKDARSG